MTGAYIARTFMITHLYDYQNKISTKFLNKAFNTRTRKSMKGINSRNNMCGAHTNKHSPAEQQRVLQSTP